MTSYNGGCEVGTGTYWNLKNGNLVNLKNEGVLPGDRSARYYRIPFALLFPLGILLGGVYIVLLPLIINAVGIYYLGKRVFGSLFGQVRRSVTFGWRPAEAYLAGKKRKEKKNHGKEEAK